MPSACKEKEVFLCLILRAVSWARASLCERFRLKNSSAFSW